MAEDKKRFVLYEYLLYFWKRKWFFVIVPVITAIVIAGAVYAVKADDSKFTGTATVFTGSTNSKKLTNDQTIAKMLNLDPEAVIVSEKGIVKLTVKGVSKEAVTKDLHQKTTKFQNQLIKDANNRIDLSNEYVTRLKDQVKTYKETIDVFNRVTRSGKLDPNQIDEVSNMTDVAIDTVSSSSERLYKLKSDVKLYEKPEVLSETVGPTKSYIPESIAIGIILGLVLTVALLMLLKYLGVARRYYEHD